MIAAMVVSLLTVNACRDAGGSVALHDGVPTGLAGDHLLLAVDYIVEDPVLTGVYDPRLISLTADGSLVVEGRDVDATLGTTVTRLDAAGLEGTWATIARSGVATDADLDLPGVVSEHGPITAFVFRVDDGTRSTRLRIDSLGSEGVYPGDPPVPATEMALRAAATQLLDALRSMRASEPWMPPALLLWWRTELPADWEATIVPWPHPIDLASAGRPLEHPVWQRCVRLDGDEAGAVARFAHTLPIDHLVELDGVRYAINVRAIHPDELDEVGCP
jgi:hypothetical protein